MLLQRLTLSESKNQIGGLKALTTLKSLLPSPSLFVNIFVIHLHILGLNILTHTR